MSNYIEDAEKRLDEERQRIKQQKLEEQAKQPAKLKAQQAKAEHEKHASSLLY